MLNFENQNLLIRQEVQEEITQCSTCKRYQWLDGIYRFIASNIPIETNLSKGIFGNISHINCCPSCLINFKS